LHFTLAKQKYILFTNSREAKSTNIDIYLNFNNELGIPDLNLINPLERITTESPTPAVKFLGIFIDPLLNFKFHINSLSSKISKALYFFRTAKNVLTQQARVSVYYALIHSHFVYGINIWSCTNTSNLNILILKQKNAIRLVCNSKYNAHTEPLFKQMSILPLPKLVTYFNLQLMHRYTINELPISFNNLWTVNAERRPDENRPLRNDQDFHIPPTRLSSTDFFPFANLPRIWNNFTEETIKNCQTKSAFNSKLKKYLLSELSAIFTCNRLLCPHCHLLT
jgi:hypothetical protein